MKEGVLDILIYLFENYFDGELDDGDEPDRDTLKQELEHAGFPAGEVERAPAGLHALVLERPTRRAGIAPLGCAVLREIVLRVQQAHRVGRAGHQRKPQLREVVLPAADRADVVKSWRVVEDQVAAARAGVVGHGARFRGVEAAGPIGGVMGR